MSSPWGTTSGGAGSELGIDGRIELDEARGEDVGTSAQEQLPEPARRALVALLMNRYVSRARQRHVWEEILAHEHNLRGRLDELYLDLVIDRDAEVAFKRQQDGDDVPRVLRREKGLTRDASLLLIFLRREYAFADPADGPVMITRDQIGEFLRAYRETGDSDGARFARRVEAAINALIKPWQLLEPDPAVDYLFTVSPVIVPLIGVDEMHRLETAFRQGAAGADASMVAGVDGSDEDAEGVQPWVRA